MEYIHIYIYIMKIVTKKDGKHVWVVLKDVKTKLYHCIVCKIGTHCSKDLVSAGSLYHPIQAKSVVDMLIKEGHK